MLQRLSASPSTQQVGSTRGCDINISYSPWAAGCTSSHVAFSAWPGMASTVAVDGTWHSCLLLHQPCFNQGLTAGMQCLPKCPHAAVVPGSGCHLVHP